MTPGAVAADAGATTGQIAVVTSDLSCGWTAATDVPWITIGTTNASAYAQAVVADHPIGYWRLNDPVASTIAADASGSGHTGASTAGITFGRTGALADGSTSAGFDGATGAVEVPHAAAFDVPAITWEAWVNVPSVSGLPRAIVNKGGSAGAFALRIQPSSSQVTVDYTLTGGTPQSVTLAPTVVGAGWVHVAFTYDGATWRAYVNGAETDAGAATGTLSTSPDPLVFGRDGTSSLDWYDGRLSDVAVYPYALRVDQLAHHVAQRTVAASGGGAVAYAIEANASGTTRTGSLTIAGVTVPVSQASTEGVAIDGSASPSPNAAGWNTTDVTVSFICAGAGTLTCPAPVVVSRDGERDIPGQVSNESGATASTLVPVKIDKTAPFLSISSPTRGQLVDAGPITITGTAMDLLSGLSAVTCGGLAATVLDSSFSCTVTAPAGTSTVTVSATDLATNVRTTVLELSTTDVVDGTPPISLRVSPQHVTMFLGDTRTFAVVDDRGRIPSDVTWSVDNAMVAIVTQGPPMALTAVSYGDVTLTAAWHGLTATTHVTVATVSAGTSEVITLWSAPPLNGAVQRIVRGVKRPGGPDITDMPPSAATAALIYTSESTGDDASPDLIRAFAPDGTERWSASAGGKVLQLSGDSSGGAVALVRNYPDYTQTLLLFSANGGQSQGPTGSGGFAIDPDGPLYYTSGNTLMSLDIGMGAGGSTSLPGGSPGEPVVLGDGTVVVPTVTGGQTFVLTFLHPDGSKVEQLVTLPNLGVYQVGWAFRAIPNGRDGFLVQLMAMRHDSHTYSGPGLEALVVGVDSAGNYTGHAEVGNAWGEGDIVVLGDKAIATGYVWYQSGNSWNRTHLGWVTSLTLDGNQVGPAAIYQPSGICPNWPAWCAFTPEETISVTSLVAVGGGGVIMGLSNGNGGGAGPAFEGMGLTHLQPEEDGTYLGAGPDGLMQFVVPQTPLPPKLIDWLYWWSHQGGSRQQNFAQEQVPPCWGSDTSLRFMQAAKRGTNDADGTTRYVVAMIAGSNPIHNATIGAALGTAISDWNSLSAISKVRLDLFVGPLDPQTPTRADFVVRQRVNNDPTFICAATRVSTGTVIWEPGLLKAPPVKIAATLMHEIGHVILLGDYGTDLNPGTEFTIMMQGTPRGSCEASLPRGMLTNVLDIDAKAVRACMIKAGKK